MAVSFLPISRRGTETLDVFARPFKTLRISVTDRCSFRCPYCMPSAPQETLPRFCQENSFLTFDEILAVTKSCVRLGLKKVRLTGGEPLLRPRLDELIFRLKEENRSLEVTLTTNGVLLKQHAKSLAASGLNRLTVSLNALDEKIFHDLTGGKAQVTDVLAGIAAATEAGFRKIKINAIILRHKNESEILPLADFCRANGHMLRFIEYMDVGNLNHWACGDVVSSAQIRAVIGGRYPLKPREARRENEVASRYTFADGKGDVGFISSVTKPFCGSCTRLRLSCDGKLYGCLFSGDGFDIKNTLEKGVGHGQLAEAIKNFWQRRADKYSENRNLFQSFPEKIKKVEMYQIGG